MAKLKFKPAADREELLEKYSNSASLEVGPKALETTTKEDVKKIHALVQEELSTLDNQKENIYIVNEKIHLAIAAASKNNYYEKPVRQSIWRTQLYLFFFDSFYMGGGIKNANIPIGSFKSCEEHQMLLYAIEHKDVSLAETTMRQHIMATYKLLVQTY